MQFSTYLPRARRCVSVSSFALLLLGIGGTGVQAGFEWVPAPQPPAPIIKAPVVEVSPVGDNIQLKNETKSSLPPLPGLASEFVEPVSVSSEQKAVIQTKRIGEVSKPKKENVHAKPYSELKPIMAHDGLSQKDHMAKPSVKNMAKETFEPLPMPENHKQTVVANSRVVMPSNAPRSAVQKLNKINGKTEVMAQPVPLAKAPVIESKPKMNEPLQPLDIVAMSKPVEPSPMLAPKKLKIEAHPTLSAPVAISAESLQDMSIYQGFGREIPLVSALRQIAPAEYSFSYGKGVDLGRRVTWNGGKPWIEVIHGILNQFAMKAVVRGKMIHVSRGEAMPDSMKKVDSQDSNDGAFLPMLPISNAQEPVPEEIEEKKASFAPTQLTSSYPSSRLKIKDPGQIEGQQSQDTMQAVKKKSNDQTVVSQAPLQDHVPAQASEFSSLEPIHLTQRIWEAGKGESLKETLDSWGHYSGFDVVWEASYDYRLHSDVFVSGSFENALETVVAKALDDQNMPQLIFVDADAQHPAKLVIRDQV